MNKPGKPCPDCAGSGRGGTNPTDGSPHDDCATCSGEGVVSGDEEA